MTIKGGTVVSRAATLLNGGGFPRHADQVLVGSPD
jgi:hypothetical protein